MGRSVSSRAERGTVARQPANHLRGQTFFTPPKVSPKITNDEATQQVSALVIGFSAGTLAKAAGRSKDSAKHWKIGHACPNLASAINLARSIPAVRAWLLEQIDGHGASPESPQTINGAVQIILAEMRRHGGGGA